MALHGYHFSKNNGKYCAGSPYGKMFYLLSSEYHHQKKRRLLIKSTLYRTLIPSVTIEKFPEISRCALVAQNKLVGKIII